MGLTSGDNQRETPHASYEQLTTFRAKAVDMGYPSLATAALIGWEWLQRKAHIFVRFMSEHYRPADRPNHVYVVNYKTGTSSWEPLFDKKGKPLFPLLIQELDSIKALRPTGGLMLRRDGTGRPWATTKPSRTRRSTASGGVRCEAKRERLSECFSSVCLNENWRPR